MDTESRLAAADRQLRRIVDALPQIAWATDERGACEIVNRRWRSFTGLSDGACGTIWPQAVHADDLADHLAAFARAASSQRPFAGELRLRRADGVHRWFAVHAERLEDEDGLPRRWLATAVDVHHHRRTQQLALRNERQRTTLALAAGRMAIWEFDCSSAQVILPSETRDLLGLGAPEASAGRTDLDRIVHPDDKAGFWQAVERALQTGSDLEHELRIVRPDGAVIWVHTRGRRLRSHAARPPRLLGVVSDITERKLAENRLRASEERFRMAAEAVQGLVYDWDTASDRVHLSPGLLDLVGFRPEETPGTGAWWMERVHPDDLPRIVAASAEAQSRFGQCLCEYRVRHRDGHWVFVRDHSVVRHDDAGNLVRVVGNTVDITRQRRIEAALAASERKFRATVEEAPVAVTHTSPDDRLTFVNRAFCDLVGYTPEELAQKTWQEITHPDDVAPDEALARRVLAGELPHYTLEKRYVHRDGHAVWIRLYGTFIRGDDGEVLHGVGVALRIREPGGAEATQQGDAPTRGVAAPARAPATAGGEDRWFRALVDNMSQLAWMADAEGFIDWYNRRWHDYTGTTPEEMAGWGWTKVHHEDHVDRVVARIRRSFQTGEPWEDVFPLRRHDGEFRWFLSRAMPIRDDEGRIERWFGTNTDITQQLLAEDALRQADRRKDEFLAMLAHELRNPLGPVRNATQVLRRVAVLEGPAARARDIIDRQVQHMARLVDDLLDVSRIQRGSVALCRETCDLVTIVRLTVEDYRSSIEEKQIGLHLDLPQEPVLVDGDAVRLAQAVGNLLHNAGKFTAAGGRVRVAVHASEDAAVVVVEDDGCGIDEQTLATLFTPFAQADHSLDRANGGLGLGLCLVKGLIDLHGGSVEARSDGPMQGASFTMRLPLSTVAIDGIASVAHPDDSRPLRILVIEDHRDAAETLGMLLEIAGHTVVLAHDGPSGLQRASELRPHVVFCDLGLPGEMDGYAVARAMRADAATAGVHLIALSGYGQDEDMRRSLAAGFDRHIVKPASHADLMAALRNRG